MTPTKINASVLLHAELSDSTNKNVKTRPRTILLSHLILKVFR